MKRKLFVWLAAAALLAGLLSGCGAMPGESSAPMDMAMPEAPMEAPSAEEMGYGGLVTDAASPELGAKRIYTADLQLETTAFEEAVRGLTSLAEDCKGWFESSSVSNRESGYRYAGYTVRVPVEQYRTFLTQAGELCHLLHTEEYVEDVSEAYYDTAGRLKTQQIKLERLQALLAKAERMEDIITIESAISETEERIDDLSGTLQHYDAKVDYATVRIDLQEVSRLSNVEEPVTGFGGRLGAAFTSGWKDFTAGVENFAVALAYGWTWVLIFAVVLVVVVRKVGKKKSVFHMPGRKKKDDKPE